MAPMTAEARALACIACAWAATAQALEPPLARCAVELASRIDDRDERTSALKALVDGLELNAPEASRRALELANAWADSAAAEEKKASQESGGARVRRLCSAAHSYRRAHDDTSAARVAAEALSAAESVGPSDLGGRPAALADALVCRLEGRAPAEDERTRLAELAAELAALAEEVEPIPRMGLYGQLAVVWHALGDERAVDDVIRRARRLTAERLREARQLGSERIRDWAHTHLGDFAWWLVDAGRADQALAIARGLPTPQREEAIRRLVKALRDEGLHDRAVAAARLLPGELRTVELLDLAHDCRVAAKPCERGALDEVLRGTIQEERRADVARELAMSGRTREAERAARQYREPRARADALARVAKLVMLTRRDRATASRLAREVLRERSSAAPARRVAVEALACAGLSDEAREAAGEDLSPLLTFVAATSRGDAQVPRLWEAFPNLTQRALALTFAVALAPDPTRDALLQACESQRAR